MSALCLTRQADGAVCLRPVKLAGWCYRHDPRRTPSVPLVRCARCGDAFLRYRRGWTLCANCYAESHDAACLVCGLKSALSGEGLCPHCAGNVAYPRTPITEERVE